MKEKRVIKQKQSKRKFARGKQELKSRVMNLEKSTIKQNVKEILLPLSHLMRICFLPTIVLQQI
jgi:hypothetical protein